LNGTIKKRLFFAKEDYNLKEKGEERGSLVNGSEWGSATSGSGKKQKEHFSPRHPS